MPKQNEYIPSGQRVTRVTREVYDLMAPTRSLMWITDKLKHRHILLRVSVADYHTALDIDIHQRHVKSLYMMAQECDSHVDFFLELVQWPGPRWCSDAIVSVSPLLAGHLAYVAK